MNQQIIICFLDGQERQFTKEYAVIMNELSNQTNKEWLLYDQETGVEINEVSLEFCSKLIAMRYKDIPQVFNNQLEFLRLNKENIQLRKENREYKPKVGYFDILISSASLKFMEEGKLQQKLKEQETEIEQLKNQVEEYQIKLQELEDRRETTTQYNQEKLNKLVELKKENKILSSKNRDQSKILEQFSQEIQQLQQDNYQKSKQLQQYSQLSKDMERLQSDNNYKSKQPEQYSQLSKDMEQQELVQKNRTYINQIRFLENFIQKKCDNHQEERQQAMIIDEGQAINTTNQLDIFLIQLDNESFNQSIIQKEFFFRNKCYKKYYKFDKELNDQNKNNKGQIMILINGQPLFIEKLYKVYKSEYEALDIILNILLIEGLIKLFENDLQSTKMKSLQFEQLNLRFPRQFLIKDQQGMYYIYQECIGNNQVDDFIPFQNSQNVDQYMSSFFKYFYFSTNKNFAITDCKLKEQKNNQQKKEIVISGIVIHSKYKQGFSQLDEGIDKINKFEQSQSQAPPGTIQKYWSDQLLKCAQKTWNDQYN